MFLVTNNGISIAGNRGVRILINGKTTAYIDIQTLLRDFPADNIAKIEVVEQPGAEYEASGSGAIINIIIKKNVRLGTHGTLSFVGRRRSRCRIRNRYFLLPVIKIN